LIRKPTAVLFFFFALVLWGMPAGAIGGPTSYEPLIAFFFTLSSAFIAAAALAIGHPIMLRLRRRPQSWHSTRKWISLGSLAAWTLTTIVSIAEYGVDILAPCIAALAVHIILFALVFFVVHLVRKVMTGD